ncbi:GDSL-type esterase/lipase family protein [Microbacterium trichothecenolyticum]|uniref:GDSL-like Lipase/Acylhydrolase n=1 Tax=Microbacterium trichothecenolyticum TaxID=69370 RepID=A0A0M2H711_MICTR|nr:GDSL-type esterase/lipase family protein [Microbacterium trichothecenolyticum]KJL40337.1 GDSL-like Lipase/Acylhydrolase [Microbacterium trichothecenolyticum]
MTRFARGVAVGVALTLSLAGCAADAEPPRATPTVSASAEPVADSLAVVGDSMTLAATACGTPGACVEASWAVGTDPSVGSIADRMAALSGSRPAVEAIAKLGARVSWARSAVDALAADPPDVVLVLLGANDACAPSTAEMTSAEDFAADYTQVLAGIRSAAPDARIVAFSVPDLLRLWELGRADPEIVRMWDESPGCRSLLASADSDAAADVDRRASVEALVAEYDLAIEAACAAAEGCTSDGGAVHDIRFEPEDISALDHFHASRAGQATLAAGAWTIVEAALSD